MGRKFDDFFRQHQSEILERIAKKESITSIGRDFAERFGVGFSTARRHIGIMVDHHNPSRSKVKTGVKDNKKTWNESQDDALWEYEGTKSIRTLEQALEFSKVDKSKWEVERHVFNSWDVTMKGNDGEPLTATNYQVKVWFKPKFELNLEKPIPGNIVVNPSKDVQMWVIIGCVHRPFHNKELWTNFISFLKDQSKRINGIIINGDYLDLRSLSSHEDWQPEGIDLQFEYQDGLQGIVEIENALSSKVRKVFHYGNHEDRFFRDKASIRKYGGSLPSPHAAMKLEETGWEVMTDWKNGFTTLGNDLDVFHGTKIGMTAAKQELDMLPNRSAIFNHTHRFGSHASKTNVAYNTGWMGDEHHDVFKYMDRGQRERWSNGFAVAYIDQDGKHYVNPIKCEQSKIFFEGKLY